MTQRAIQSVKVEFVGGGEATWHGVGTVNLIRTPAKAQGTPVLKDSDQSYVNAILVFDRLAWDQAPEAAASEAPAGEGVAHVGG